MIRDEKEWTVSDILTEMLNGEPYEYYPIGSHVVSAVGVSGGRPTFKYTRIEIAGTISRIKAGESIEDVVQGYGGRVSLEAVLEAIQILSDSAVSPDLRSMIHVR